jgi:hypothetical protein
MDDFRFSYALRAIEEAQRATFALYLADPDDELARANTPVPIFLATIVAAQHSAREHLLNVRDFPANPPTERTLRNAIARFGGQQSGPSPRQD